MIPLLKDAHEFIYVDSQLFYLDVAPFIPPPPDTSADKRLLLVLKYIEGVAEVNNLDFSSEGPNIYLKGGDFPQAQLSSLGFIDEKSRELFNKLQWDIIDYAGKQLVEVPKAHENYLKELTSVIRSPFQLQFIISFFENGLESSTGITLGAFVDLNLNSFDTIYSGNVSSLIKAYPNRAGFSLRSTPQIIKRTLNESITTSLGGLIGDSSSISMADEIPYRTSDVTGDGLTVRTQVNFISAGFTIRVESREIPQGIVFDFDIENSAPDFSNTVDGMPVIRRRQFKTRRVIVIDEVVEIARMEKINDINTSSGLPFLKRFRGRSRNDSKGVVTVIVKRIR